MLPVASNACLVMRIPFPASLSPEGDYAPDASIPPVIWAVVAGKVQIVLRMV
jgi:hypothetical protein